MNDLRCPVCGEMLGKREKSYVCPQGHTFDKAASGYVNLLLSNKMHAKTPGDSKAMMIARRDFLNNGYYQVLSDAINSWFRGHLSKPFVKIVDAGCGEGYYTARLQTSLEENGQGNCVIGFDLSKAGLQIAAKRNKKVTYAVASLFDMPLLDHCADAMINLFAPYSEKEFHRVLKKDGILIMVVPLPRHLFGLKEVLYEKPYENEVKQLSLEGFAPLERIQVSDVIEVEGQQQIQNLFCMTPYYWHTPRDAAEKLQRYDHIRTEIGFELLIFQAQ